MNNREFNYKALFSNWLFAAFLLLSFFTFSGIASRSQVKQIALRTEVIAYTTQSKIARSITYCRAQKQTLSRRNAISVFAVSAIELAYFASLQEKTLSINYSNKKINNLQSILLYHHKLISQNTSDEPIIALV